MASTPPADPADKTATRRASEQDVFMREVDEAVRQDEALTIARRYGWPIAGAVVLGLAAFGGWLFWQDRQDAALETSSEQLVAALDELEAGNLDTADDELAAINGGGAATMAQLARAGLAMQQDRAAEAVTLYAAIAENAEAPQQLRDLAAIRMMAARFDAVEPQVVIDRIGPLAVPDSPWFGSAGELVAFAYLKQDKPEEAGALLAAIAKDQKVPQSIRARTRQLAGLLGVDAIAEDEEAVAELTGEATAAAAASPPPAAAQDQ